MSSRNKKPQKSDGPTYYDVLGISQTAGESEIKSAYKKLAVKYHPDRNPDADAVSKFQEISNAYQTLIDPEKRDIYDKYGEEGLNGGAGGGGDDLFSSFFGGGFPGSSREKKQSNKGKDNVLPLDVTLEELYLGADKKIPVSRKRTCSDCKGQGTTKPGLDSVCSDCKGSGFRTQVIQMGPFIQQARVECSRCDGEGTALSNENKKFICKVCNGKKVVEQEKHLEVHIDKGMRDNQKVVFDGESDEAPNLKAGDVIFVVRCEEHPTFKREGNHLIMKKKISLTESLTGFEFELTHLDGRKVVIKSDPGKIIQPGDLKVVRGQGMPIHRRPFDFGNLFIKFDIDYPASLTKDQVSQLEKILPAKKKLVRSKDHEEEFSVETAEKTDVTDEGGDDEDDDHAHGQTVNCAQQ